MFDFGWPTWVLLGCGLAVIGLEIVFPSAGLLGLLAGGCLVAGGWLAVRDAGVAALGGYALVVVLLVPVAVAVAFRLLPRTPFGRRMILQGPSFSARTATEDGLAELVGKEGLADTALRPAGIASFGDRRVDVVTRGSHVAAGERVRVLRVEGNRVIVEGAGR